MTGEAPKTAEEYKIRLQAIDNAPMPATDTLNILGSASGTFTGITYERPGIYCYKLYQEAGSNKKAEYDKTVYYIKVSVMNGTNGSLESAIAAYTDEAMTGVKSDIVFKNKYTADPSPAPSVTPSPTPKSTPTKTTSVKAAKATATGDSSSGEMWFAVIGIGAAVMAIAMTRMHRKNK